MEEKEKTAVQEKKESTDDWKMSVEEFNQNGCLMNGD